MQPVSCRIGVCYPSGRKQRRHCAVKRRDFITLLGGTVAAWPLAARAQRSKPAIIGLLGSGTAAAQSEWTSAFVQRLRELGWNEGRNLTIEYRWAEGDAVSDLLKSPLSSSGLRSMLSLRTEHSPAARGQAGDLGDPNRLRDRRRIRLAQASSRVWRGRVATLPACQVRHPDLAGEAPRTLGRTRAGSAPVGIPVRARAIPLAP